jgi:hypothetical protein
MGDVLQHRHLDARPFLEAVETFVGVVSFPALVIFAANQHKIFAVVSRLKTHIVVGLLGIPVEGHPVTPRARSQSLRRKSGTAPSLGFYADRAILLDHFLDRRVGKEHHVAHGTGFSEARECAEVRAVIPPAIGPRSITMTERPRWLSGRRQAGNPLPTTTPSHGWSP